MITVWTYENRDRLFRKVVEQFGPYATWEKVNTPGRGLDETYLEFCARFAEEIGAKSARAVMMAVESVRIISPILKGVDAATTIQNLAAAYKNGFIGVHDMPELKRPEGGPAGGRRRDGTRAARRVPRHASA